MWACCLDSIVVDLDDSKAVSEFRCDKWSCEECCLAKRRRIIATILGGHPDRMWTITSRRGENGDPVKARNEIVAAWQDFIDSEVQRRGIKRPQYVAVVEATEEGWPHIHFAIRHFFIDHERLSAWMARRANSPVVRFDILRQGRSAASYMAKYLGKEPHQFGTGKRWWKTQAWELAKRPPPWREKLPGERPLMVEERWHVIRDLHLTHGWLLLAQVANRVLLGRPP